MLEDIPVKTHGIFIDGERQYHTKGYNFISILLVWAAPQLFQVCARFWSILTPGLSTLDCYRSE